MKTIILFLIKVYQYLSRFTYRKCRFYPSCSSYSYEAINRYGFFRGVALSLMRITKCHPWHPGGYDPVK